MPREAKLFASSSGSVVRGYLKFRANITPVGYAMRERRKWQISSQGGIQPRWSGDGRELFFRSGVIAGMSTLMTVPVQTEGAFTAGSPRPLSVSLRARRPRLCCHARRPAFHLYQRVETRGQCDADECRLELECGAGKEITVASGPTSDPRETQVAVFA